MTAVSIQTSEKFTNEIEELVKKAEMTYAEAIVHHCAQLDIEYNAAKKLMLPKLKEKLRREAVSLNVIKCDNKPLD